ncbi:MAG: DUF3857 domain-containing protein [Acidobacteriota bacterium]
MTRRGPFLLAAAAVLAALSSVPTAKAAVQAPDWVLRAKETKVDPAVLQARPEPGATVLWRQRIITAGSSSGATRLYERHAVRILTPGGASSGTFYSHYDDDSKVDVEGAWTLHADGKAEALKLADVVSVQAANPEYFTDTFVLAFRPPRLAPGDIAAYALSRRSRRDVYQWSLDLQGGDPIAAQEVVIDLPEGWGHRWRLSGAVDGYSGPRSGEGGPKATYPFPAQRGIQAEQRSGARADLSADMEISILPPAGKFPELVFQSWNDVAAWFAKKSGAVRASPPPAAVPLFTGDAVREPARWVQDRIRYVALEAGEGGWVPREPALVTKRLYGDCKDKAFLLLALLARSGIEAYPVLTRGTDDGAIDGDFPSPVQFNHVIVAIRQPAPSGLAAEIRAKGLVAVLFDPTSPWTPYGQLPAQLQGARGLLVRSDGGELLDFPFAPSAANRLVRSVDADLTSEGGLRAEVTETSDGALSERALYQAWTPQERTDAISRFAEREIRGSRASALQLGNLGDPGKPMEARFHLASEGFLRTTGALTLLPVLPFAVGPGRIAATAGAERRFPIHLGAPERRELVVRFRPGPGLKIDALPDPISAENAYASYRFAAAVEDGRIVVRETYETKKPSIPLSDWTAWKAIEGAAARAAASQAVLVRAP